MKQNANTTSASTSSIRQIRFAIGECSLGFILVAISELGICAIAFGDGPNVLASEVRDRFPEAERIIDDARVQPDAYKSSRLYRSERLGVGSAARYMWYNISTAGVGDATENSGGFHDQLHRYSPIYWFAQGGAGCSQRLRRQYVGGGDSLSSRGKN